MKVVYDHLLNFIPSKPSVEEISQKFFQLGHEHEIQGNIFDMEITPNRGDCLSLKGLLRDLAVFYKVQLDIPIYENNIPQLDFNFINKAKDACPHISFLKIDISEEVQPYQGVLKRYFDDLEIKKNNFFTDISNYISYETGQPTHCYDAKKIGGTCSLKTINYEKKFETLLGQKIELTGDNLVFLNNTDSIINLAGVMGGMNTCCSENTKSVLIECAYFNPENIIGKSVKYDIKSDAAHKFERGVDPLFHEKILRRFIRIIEEHTTINNVEILTQDYQEYNPTKIPFNVDRINNILGISLNNTEFSKYLSKLNFDMQGSMIISPSYRSDIQTENDIAEEIARVVGYDNIAVQPYKIPELINVNSEKKVFEKHLKNFLNDHGFYEVINNPFTKSYSKKSIKVDNPLDSNKKFLRTNLERSLLDNLLYNEKRQEDSVKLYEIADVYYCSEEEINSKRILGIIGSGRVAKNYIDFSKKINKKYITGILNKVFNGIDINVMNIDRNAIDSKSNNQIIYVEIELDSINKCNYDFSDYEKVDAKKINFVKYSSISPFPSSTRDLSFAIKNPDKFLELQDYLLNFSEDIIKESYIFDFYNDIKKDEIKIGFRLVFQSKTSTITDLEVNAVMNRLIDETLSIESVSIPGLDRFG